MPYQLGDEVLVPASRIGLHRHHSALYRTTVAANQAPRSRTVNVNVGGGNVQPIATKFVHDHIGVAIITLSDFDSDDFLLHPLRKSVLQFLRLLLPDDALRSVLVRSLAELRHFWTANHATYSHVILLGHGRPTGVQCLVDDWVDAATLGAALTSDRPKHFTSLACETGQAPFAEEFSRLTICKTFIGPHESAHGAVASMYVQTYFSLHLLGGSSEKVAYNNASVPVHEQASFKFWKNGTLR